MLLLAYFNSDLICSDLTFAYLRYMYRFNIIKKYFKVMNSAPFCWARYD